VSIKSDRWIRRMALEHGMIEPFVEQQVRDGVISYGLSSYGYDMRIANEFKVFTNVYNTLVDPKHFDERSFVDITADYCDIPPNSFALARSVELFRIPRNVLAICLGKSTYARCFRGDTRVALVDGTAPTLEEMARRAEQGEMFWGYSIGQHGRLIVTVLDAPRYIGHDQLVEITLDNDEVIHCTPDHQFMARDGRMLPANDLRPGTSLMPLYRTVARGYEMVYQPLDGHMYPTHRLADEWNVRQNFYADTPGTHRHHIDQDRRNNAPWNITRVDAGEHIRYHNTENYGEEFDPAEHSAAIRDAFVRLSQDPAWRKRFAGAQRERALQFWHDEGYAEARATLNEKQRNWTEERMSVHRAGFQRYYSNPEHVAKRAQLSQEIWSRDDGTRRERQREIMRSINIRNEITAEVVRAALDETGSIRGAARLLDCDRSVFRRFPEVIKAFKGQPERKNHKVSRVRQLPGDHDVYCLTVPEAGNFALEAGVFVHNCGIILNTTPFEPGWRGYVTLELTNSTPLPARIYANEGIGQVLFFEGDEDCEISYADKNGKYLDQVGVVPPRL
jgi:deoxycytidine triphosphate deaminase